MEPFLADIETSPRALPDTMFSISQFLDRRGDIKGVTGMATRRSGFPGQKSPFPGCFG
jgi:hypothetical protein